MRKVSFSELKFKKKALAKLVAHFAVSDFQEAVKFCF